jgi:hypothetical protein
MTTALKERMRLDKFLRAYGSGIGRLVRVVGTTNQSSYSVDVRAHVRQYLPEELTRDESLMQGDSKVIISFTEIMESQWPGAVPPVSEESLPIRVGDKFIWRGRTKNIQLPEHFILLGEGVRIQLQVRGQ